MKGENEENLERRQNLSEPEPRPSCYGGGVGRPGRRGHSVRSVQSRHTIIIIIF